LHALHEEGQVNRARDVRVLNALLDQNLSDAQTVMLEDMRQSLDRYPCLTERQRGVVNEMIERFGLGADFDEPTPLTPAQVKRAAELGPMKISGGMPMSPPPRRAT
jgi:hypothetical protein